MGNRNSNIIYINSYIYNLHSKVVTISSPRSVIKIDVAFAIITLPTWHCHQHHHSQKKLLLENLCCINRLSGFETVWNPFFDFGRYIVPWVRKSKSARLSFILRKPLKIAFKRQPKFDSYKISKTTELNKPMVELKSFSELPKPTAAAAAVEIQIYTSSTNFYNNGKLKNNFISHLSDHWLARYFRFS